MAYVNLFYSMDGEIVAHAILFWTSFLCVIYYICIEWFLLNKLKYNLLAILWLTLSICQTIACIIVNYHYNYAPNSNLIFYYIAMIATLMPLFRFQFVYLK